MRPRLDDVLDGFGEQRRVGDGPRYTVRTDGEDGSAIAARQVVAAEASTFGQRPDVAGGERQGERGQAQLVGIGAGSGDYELHRCIKEVVYRQRENGTPDAEAAGQRRQQGERALSQRAVAALAERERKIEQNARE